MRTKILSILIILLCTVSIGCLSPPDTKNVEPQYDDDEFITFVKMVEHSSCYDSLIDALDAASETGSYYDVLLVSERCEQHFSSYYAEITNYQVSPSLQKDYEEFEQFIYNMKEAFYYAHSGAEYCIDGSMYYGNAEFETAIIHLRKAEDNVNRCDLISW